MKRVYIVAVLLFFMVFDINAQNVYSKQNLANASQIELNDYLIKAKKNKTTGLILTISGPVLFGGTLLLARYSDMSLDMLGFLLLTSIVSTGIGIPTLVINSLRIKRINELNKGFTDGVFLDMSPYSYQDKLTQSHSVGIKLQLRF